MIHVDEQVTIDRPIDEVFAFVADQTKAPQRQAGLAEVRRTTDGPPGPGTRHVLVRTFLGRRLEASNEYTSYEPNKTIAFKSTSGPVSFTAGYRTAPIAGGTEVTSWIEMRPQGFFGLAEPFIAAHLRRDVQTNLAQLKSLLEDPGTGASDR